MRLSHDVQHPAGSDAATGGPNRSSRKSTSAVILFAVWTVASVAPPSLPTAAAAPGNHARPHRVAGHGQSHHQRVAHAHAGHRHAAPAPHASPFATANPAVGSHCKCLRCGKNRQSIARKILNGLTAGTDYLIFGTSYDNSCDCDFGGSACDAGCDSGCDTACDAIGHTPFPAFAQPVPVPPGVELLPAPTAPSTRDAAAPAPAPPAPKTPTSTNRSEDQRDPFSDDPVYQGSKKSPISRSAYYE